MRKISNKEFLKKYLEYAGIFIAFIVFVLFILFSFLHSEETSLSTEEDIRIYIIMIAVMALIILYLLALLTRNMLQRMAAVEELKSSAERLRELNTTKDKFFSIIAHDLKNPLGSFKQATDLLVDNFDEISDSDKRELLYEMKRTSSNIFNLLENLLTWSRSQRGKIEFNPEDEPLYYVAREVKGVLDITAEKKNISIENNIPEDLRAEFDINMIMTVIRNLVANAVKFTHRGGKVKIDAEDKNGTVRVSVSDTGIGIEPAKKEKLFDIGEAHSSKGTDNEEGTGLGLIICKEFVDKHNGRIWVESEVDKGSTFYVQLPKKQN